MALHVFAVSSKDAVVSTPILGIIFVDFQLPWQPSRPTYNKCGTDSVEARQKGTLRKKTTLKLMS